MSDNKTFFRFCLQTVDHRISETWSFYGNWKGDVYASRSSMRGWQKISFHYTGAGHIKTSRGSDTPWEMDFCWETKKKSDEPTQLVRLIYTIEKQGARLPVDERVPIYFEEISGVGSIYLDVFFSNSAQGLSLTGVEGENICAHQLTDGKWVLAYLSADAERYASLPESLAGATFHVGDKVFDEHGKAVALENSTAVFYASPKSDAPLTIHEISYGRMDF